MPLHGPRGRRRIMFSGGRGPAAGLRPAVTVTRNCACQESESGRRRASKPGPSNRTLVNSRRKAGPMLTADSDHRDVGLTVTSGPESGPRLAMPGTSGRAGAWRRTTSRRKHSFKFFDFKFADSELEADSESDLRARTVARQPGCRCTEPQCGRTGSGTGPVFSPTRPRSP